jgi:uncharacterized protein (TIGR02246 family)
MLRTGRRIVMRLMLRAVVALGAIVSMLAPSVALAQKNEASAMATEKEVRALYQQFTEAWNRHDLNAVGSMWIPEGDHMEPDGRGVRGQASVEALLKEQHASVFKKTHLALKIDSVWLVTADVALADGTYEITDIVAPDGTAIPKRAGHLTSILVHKDGKWRIAGSRLMIPTALPYKS